MWISLTFLRLVSVGSCYMLQGSPNSRIKRLLIWGGANVIILEIYLLLIIIILLCTINTWIIPNHLPPAPWSLEHMSSMKVVPYTIKIGDRWSVASLSLLLRLDFPGVFNELQVVSQVSSWKMTGTWCYKKMWNSVFSIAYFNLNNIELNLIFKWENFAIIQLKLTHFSICINWT